MKLMRYTSVPVKPDTLRRLRLYKTEGRSYDDVINELMEETPPEAFIKEMLRRLKEEERVPWRVIKARLKL